MSSAWNKEKEEFPDVPETLNAGNFNRSEYTNFSAPHNTAPQYTPYLGLRARLSQVWINRWTILVALIICRVLLAIRDMNYDIGQAKSEALSACTTVENIGSAMASMPHYLSEGVNALAADGVTKAINGLMDMLMLSVTALEEIVLFVINMMTSTYVCLITLAVSGSLHVAIEMIEEAGALMNKSINSITGELSSDITSFTNDLNTFLSSLNIASIFGGSKKAPTIDLSSQINALNSIQIDPTTLDADLTKLNNSIPTFAQVQNFTNTVISLPFNEIKQLINESVAAYTFDKSVFPVAQKQALTFCSDNPAISNFFDGLYDTLNTARMIFIIVLTIVAALVCIPMAFRELWMWRTMQQRAILVQKNAFDPMDVIYIASRPYTSTIGIKAASRFKSTKRQILTRWTVAYATSLPALFLLALGFAGLFSCLCQYIILKVIEREVPALADEVGAFADLVVKALNTASESWAIAANGVINSTNTKVNSDVFGWVNTSTTAVNGTLNTFTDQMSTALNDTFGGTVLYGPITGVLSCLLGLKVAGIQKGLTWASDNAHVTFPEFRPDVFSLGAAASITNSTSTENFLSSPGDVTSDDITNAIVKVANKVQNSIEIEIYISASLIGLWLLIVLIGFIRALVAMLSRDKTRGEGGPAGFTGDNRIPLTPRSPNRNDTTKFPEFGGPVSSVHPNNSSVDVVMAADALAGTEKIGRVGHRSVEASVKPGHERSSSYGYLEKTRR